MSCDNMARLRKAMASMPAVAILRGVQPDEVIAVAQAIYDAGIRVIEVPLNSPAALISIQHLAVHFGDAAIIGAGTVLCVEDVARCHDAGAQIVVSPNMNVAVIRATVAAGMISVPGCLTPTEAFAALDAGAHAIKLFPGELIPAAAVKGMRAVLPKEAIVLVVGGVSTDAVAGYRAAGVDGFGIGSVLYRPGITAAEAGRNAEKFVAVLA